MNRKRKNFKQGIMLTKRQYINIFYFIFGCRIFTNKAFVVYRQNRRSFSLNKNKFKKKELNKMWNLCLALKRIAQLTHIHIYRWIDKFCNHICFMSRFTNNLIFPSFLFVDMLLCVKFLLMVRTLTCVIWMS